jgi:hypothetical protein
MSDLFRDCLLASLVVSIGCDEPSSESSDTTSSETSATSESGGPEWVEICGARPTESECNEDAAEFGCMWVEILALAPAVDACATTVLRSECIAFERHGNGCSSGSPPSSCGDESYPPHWYREGASGEEYVVDHCERMPLEWQQCWSSPDDPAACQCICLDAD